MSLLFSRIGCVKVKWKQGNSYGKFLFRLLSVFWALNPPPTFHKLSVPISWCQWTVGFCSYARKASFLQCTNGQLFNSCLVTVRGEADEGTCQYTCRTHPQIRAIPFPGKLTIIYFGPEISVQFIHVWKFMYSDFTIEYTKLWLPSSIHLIII